LWHDDLLVCRRQPQQAPAPLSKAQNPVLEMKPATLGGLADHAGRSPQVLDDSVLRDARQRLKNGEAGYLFTCHGELASVIWLSTQGQITLHDGAEGRRLDLPQDAWLITDYQVAPQHRKADILRSALEALASVASQRDLQLWIVCRRRDGYAKPEIESAGFAPAYRFVSARLLRFRRSRLTPLQDHEAAN
jgi:hypothetical protein